MVIPPNVEHFDIELRVWDREAEDLAELVEMYGSTLKDVRRDLDAVAGINIYRDGFRVFPYGEPRNDWLRLDLRRVQNPHLRLSNNQIMGYVLISADQNPLLRDQSNREGLIDGPAFDDLSEVGQDGAGRTGNKTTCSTPRTRKKPERNQVGCSVSSTW